MDQEEGMKEKELADRGTAAIALWMARRTREVRPVDAHRIGEVSVVFKGLGVATFDFMKDDPAVVADLVHVLWNMSIGMAKREGGDAAKAADAVKPSPHASLPSMAFGYMYQDLPPMKEIGQDQNPAS
jgi:hypothetical protein